MARWGTAAQHQGQHTKTAGKGNVGAGQARPRCSGRPDDLAGARSRHAESRAKHAFSTILAEEADSGAQGGEGAASAEGRRAGRSLAAEGATAHVCAAVPHTTPPQLTPLTLAMILTRPDKS